METEFTSQTKVKKLFLVDLNVQIVEKHVESSLKDTASSPLVPSPKSSQHQQSSSLVSTRDWVLSNVGDEVNYIAQLVILEAMDTDPPQDQANNDLVSSIAQIQFEAPQQNTNVPIVQVISPSLMS